MGVGRQVVEILINTLAESYIEDFEKISGKRLPMRLAREIVGEYLSTGDVSDQTVQKVEKFLEKGGLK